ncbi:hypothetical protein [Streptomyces californicus]|uniref:hypothetical protein n=1 Tax=Streptomyces californicus TaxID=67351 RepID=UPI0033B6CD8E
MTEGDHTTVNDPHGPVNSGPGHQHVYYGVGADWMARKGVSPLRIVRDDRLHLADRFTPPPGFRIAADRLEKPGSVVLVDAEPGSGRRAAAIMLLHGLGEDGGTDEEDARFEELPVSDEDAAPLAVGDGDRFLLDLSGIGDEGAYVRAQHLLAVRRSQVQEAGAHMVVVLPAALRHAQVSDLAPHTVTLGRPRGVAVVTRHLRMDRMTFRSTDLLSAELRGVFDRSPMGELARLTRLVRAARDSGRFGTDFAGWLDQAMHAVTDRAAEVGRQMTTITTTPARALLLATAMFEGARADTVYAAWRGLLRTVKHEEEATTELARMDFGERLATLGIERDPDGLLRFDRLAYADAVRTYFWANFPGVRDDLKDWIRDAAGLPDLTIDDRVNIVLRFGERALAVGRPAHLFDLVAHWAGGAMRGVCDPRALAGLELGLSHERHGIWFRRQLYHRARSGPLTDGLSRVMTAACLHSLVVTHPDQAVVRLHYLAVREGEAAHEARRALLDIARGDRRLYRLLIDRLRARTQRESPGTGPHLRLLVELLRSDRAPDPPPWPDLFLGWEAVLSQPPAEFWSPMVRDWLDAAAADSTRRLGLEVLVGATAGRPAALHRLYAIACGWAAGSRDPSRTAVATHFWQRIDHTQYTRADGSERPDDTGAGSPTTGEAR